MYLIVRSLCRTSGTNILYIGYISVFKRGKKKKSFLDTSSLWEMWFTNSFYHSWVVLSYSWWCSVKCGSSKFRWSPVWLCCCCLSSWHHIWESTAESKSMKLFRRFAVLFRSAAQSCPALCNPTRCMLCSYIRALINSKLVFVCGVKDPFHSSACDYPVAP